MHNILHSYSERGSRFPGDDGYDLQNVASQENSRLTL